MSWRWSLEFLSLRWLTNKQDPIQNLIKTLKCLKATDGGTTVVVAGDRVLSFVLLDLIKTCSLKATDGGMAGVVADDGDDTQRFQCFPLTRCLQLQLVVIVFPTYRVSLSSCFPLQLPTSAIVNIVIVLPSHQVPSLEKVNVNIVIVYQLNVSTSTSLARVLVNAVIVFPSPCVPPSSSLTIIIFNIFIVFPFHDFKFFGKGQRQYFHCVSLSPASFLLWATPPSTCSVLTSRELRFRLKSLKNKSSQLWNLGWFQNNPFLLFPGSGNNTLGDSRH